jgi:hypothetical protein
MGAHIQKKVFECLAKQNLNIEKLEKKASLKRGLIREILRSKLPHLKSLFRIGYFLNLSLEELTGVRDIHLFYFPVERQWDQKLYEGCLEFGEALSREHKVVWSFSEAFSFIEGVYVYSACQAPAPSPLDETFGRWLFETTVLKKKGPRETQPVEHP